MGGQLFIQVFVFSDSIKALKERSTRNIVFNNKPRNTLSQRTLDQEQILQNYKEQGPTITHNPSAGPHHQQLGLYKNARLD